MQNERNFLSQDPNTDSFGAAKLGQAYGNAALSFTAARAHLQADAARSGMVGSGSLEGALGASYNAQAANSAGLQNSNAQASIANKGQRLGQITALDSGVAGQDYSRGNAALGAEGSIDDRLGSSYLSLGEGELGQSQAYDAAQGQLIAGGASMIGQSLYKPKYPWSSYGGASPTGQVPSYLSNFTMPGFG